MKTEPLCAGCDWGCEFFGVRRCAAANAWAVQQAAEIAEAAAAEGGADTPQSVGNKSQGDSYGESLPAITRVPAHAPTGYLADRAAVMEWAWQRHKLELGTMKLGEVRTTCDRLLGTETDEEATLAEAFALWAAKVREEG